MHAIKISWHKYRIRRKKRKHGRTISNDAIVLIAWTSGGANNEDGEHEDKSRNSSFSRTESELV